MEMIPGKLLVTLMVIVAVYPDAAVFMCILPSTVWPASSKSNTLSTISVFVFDIKGIQFTLVRMRLYTVNRKRIQERYFLIMGKDTLHISHT